MPELSAFERDHSLRSGPALSSETAVTLSGPGQGHCVQMLRACQQGSSGARCQSLSSRKLTKGRQALSLHSRVYSIRRTVNAQRALVQ